MGGNQFGLTEGHTQVLGKMLVPTVKGVSWVRGLIRGPTQKSDGKTHNHPQLLDQSELQQEEESTEMVLVQRPEEGEDLQDYWQV